MHDHEKLIDAIQDAIREEFAADLARAESQALLDKSELKMMEAAHRVRESRAALLEARSGKNKAMEVLREAMAEVGDIRSEVDKCPASVQRLAMLGVLDRVYHLLEWKEVGLQGPPVLTE